MNEAPIQGEGDPMRLDTFSMLENLSEEVRSFYEEVKDLRITPAGDARTCSHLIREQFDFESPVPAAELFESVRTLMRDWTIHVTHPRSFGNFNPSVTVESIVGDALTALYNPQLAVWAHAPAALELENRVLDLFRARFGFDVESSIANFTSGGAEANLSALVVALTHGLPDYGEKGLVGVGEQPTLYLSTGGHESFIKAAHIAGLGRTAIRRVPADANHQLDVASLATMVREDRSKGKFPLMVVGTAGTTAMGMIDPLCEIGDFCRSEGMWFHVDAAWGGAAILSDRLKSTLAGIESADSITCDAHKWLSVPMGAGMFFCRHRSSVLQAFRISTGYMPEATSDRVDPYSSTMQWSRRCIGLKVFISLAARGRLGMAQIIEHQAAMGDYLRTRLVANGWSVTNNTPLPVVCFTHNRIRNSANETKRIADKIVSNGSAWISNIEMTNGQPSLKACVTSFRTQSSDIDHLVESLQQSLRVH